MKNSKCHFIFDKMKQMSNYHNFMAKRIYFYKSDASAATTTRRNLDDAIWIIWILASKFLLFAFENEFDYNKADKMLSWCLWIEKGQLVKAKNCKYFEILPFFLWCASKSRVRVKSWATLTLKRRLQLLQTVYKSIWKLSRPFVSF